MTTVDVRITGPTGSGTLYLHNGLWGPASSALHALSGQFMNGTLTGPWNIAEIKATVPGAVVREVLAAVDEADPGVQRRGPRSVRRLPPCDRGQR